MGIRSPRTGWKYLYLLASSRCGSQTAVFNSISRTVLLVRAPKWFGLLVYRGRLSGELICETPDIPAVKVERPHCPTCDLATPSPVPQSLRPFFPFTGPWRFDIPVNFEPHMEVQPILVVTEPTSQPSTALEPSYL